MRGLQSTCGASACPADRRRPRSRVDRMWESFSPAAQERILRLLARVDRPRPERGGAAMSKVERQHLARKAYVYVRQSTMAQVERNTESLERQYELLRAGGRARLGRRRGGRRRLRPRPLGQEHRRPRRLPGAGGRCRAGQGRDRARDRGLAAGAAQRRLVPAAGSVRADRHADRRLRRHLSPGAAQRPARARPEGHDVARPSCTCCAPGCAAAACTRRPRDSCGCRCRPATSTTSRARADHARRGRRRRDQRPCSRTSRQLESATAGDAAPAGRGPPAAAQGRPATARCAGRRRPTRRSTRC